MKISRQRINKTALFALAAMALSSCNRGYGCPTDFDAGTFIETMQSFLSVLF